MNLFKYLTAVFPTENNFFKWVVNAGEEVDELRHGYGTVGPGYTAVKSLPELPKNNNLILPEGYDETAEHTSTHIWVLDLQKPKLTFYLVPRFGHIQLPGYKDVYLVSTSDIIMSCSADANKWSKIF